MVTKRRRILTTANLEDKKLLSEKPKVETEKPEVEQVKRGGISFMPQKGLSNANSVSPKEEATAPSISGLPPRSLPSPWGKPLVVFIPAWNCRKWIQDAFITLSDQTLPEDEWGVIVFDDASDDGMEHVCRKWDAEHLRVKTNRGKAAQINLASRLFPKETIFVELDADDGLLPNALEIIQGAWKETPDAVLIYSQYTQCSDTMVAKRQGHCRQAGTSLEEAGYISHLKTYRAEAIREVGYLDENVYKSVDKELVYCLQELSEKTKRPLVFIDKILYYYRRRKEGSITMSRQHDATLARRNAYKRRNSLSSDTLCVFSASNASDTGGPGIFWGRLLKELEKQEEINIVSNVNNADIVFGNIRVAKGIDHQRPWVIRLDGVRFNSRQDYIRGNFSLKESVMNAEGILYQSKWGKAMADEYCGESWGERTILLNGVDPPEDWKKGLEQDRKIFLACCRWGDQKYKRRFKRLEETIAAFDLSGLESKGYRLVILGQHYLDEKDHSYAGVEFKHRVSEEEVWNYLKDSVCFVHLSWFDCCPNGVVEALAAKVPVIYCAEGISELVRNAGIRIPDSPLNHPCDIGKPPRLILSDISGAMQNIIEEASFYKNKFPDVSMKIYGKKCIEFLRNVYEKGPKKWGLQNQTITKVKPVIASTEDMR